MATPTLVQNGTYTSGSASYLEITLTGVTAGNLIAAAGQVTESTVRTFSFSDDRAQTWAIAVQHPTSSTREGAIGYLKNCSSGTTVVRVTPSSTITFYMHCCEIASASTTTPLDVFDYYDDTAGTDDHYCSASGVNTTTDVFVYTTGVLGSSATSVGVGTGFTSLYTGGVTGPLIQYKTSAGALTAERGYWVSVGTDRFGYSLMAVFKAGVSGATASTSEALTVTDAASQLVTLILVSASASDSVTVTDEATQLLTTLLINASASDDVTVTDVSSQLLTTLLSAWEAVTVTDISDVAASILAEVVATWDDLIVTDAATQAVGILASAAEWSGSDTLRSSNW